MNDLNELNNLNDINDINKEIIYEENTDVDSEEIESELNEESILEDTNVEEKKSTGFSFDFSEYCNFNSLLVLVALIGLVYYLFKDQINSFLNINTTPKLNLCA